MVKEKREIKGPPLPASKYSDSKPKVSQEYNNHRRHLTTGVDIFSIRKV